QILVNLLGNAVKFTQKGEVLVSVEAYPTDCEGQSADCESKASDAVSSNPNLTVRSPQSYEIHFAVKDTGIGIPADRVERLFKSFSQVDASTTRQFGGTGLGLAISKRLSEMMGGWIWVESRLGKGSTFHFTIPADGGSSLKQRYVAANRAQLSGKRVLIVDDSAVNRRILSKQTEAWGMKSLVAADAFEALNLMGKGERFSLALLDMNMPGMDGAALAAEIHKRPNMGTLRIVILSSSGLRRELLSQVDVAAILTKPIKQHNLYKVLLDVLGNASVKESGPKLSVIDKELSEKLPLRILLAEDNVVNQKVALSM